MLPVKVTELWSQEYWLTIGVAMQIHTGKVMAMQEDISRKVVSSNPCAGLLTTIVIHKF